MNDSTTKLSRDTMGLLVQGALLPDNQGIMMTRENALEILKVLDLPIPQWEQKGN